MGESRQYEKVSVYGDAIFHLSVQGAAQKTFRHEFLNFWLEAVGPFFRLPQFIMSVAAVY